MGSARRRDWMLGSSQTIVMSRDNIASLIEDCRARVPSRQAEILDYLHRLTESTANSTPRQVAHNLWLLIFRPDAIHTLSRGGWKFPLDSLALGLLQKFISRGWIGMGDTVAIALVSKDGEKHVQTLDVMQETMLAISREFPRTESSPTIELKLIQMILTAGSTPNRAIGGGQLTIALNKLGEVARLSQEIVNQHAALAAITQIIEERMEDVGLNRSVNCIDQGK